jgi:hypothetical protein
VARPHIPSARYNLPLARRRLGADYSGARDLGAGLYYECALSDRLLDSKEAACAAVGDRFDGKRSVRCEYWRQRAFRLGALSRQGVCA